MFEMQIVSNTPLVSTEDQHVLAETFLTQIGYIPKGTDLKSSTTGIRDSVPYRLFMDFLMANPSKAWAVEELAALLETSKPTIYRHINKLKNMDLLEQADVVFDGQNRKGFRFRFGDFAKAWSFAEANVKMAMENYRKSVDHIQKVMEKRRREGE